MKRILLGTFLFTIITFLVQALSHFVINVEHYGAVPYMRPKDEVIFPLGFLTMIVQGSVLSYMYGFFSNEKSNWKRGLVYGFLMCLLFVSYPTFTEPGKYQVPDIGSWIVVEGTAGLVQFCSFGMIWGIVYARLK